MTSSKDINHPLRNFIYLDEQKLNSFVSQLFSGVTEYVTSSTNEEKCFSESQKGEVLSGKILKAILKENKNDSEKKFLYDYSYHLFEEKLLELNAIQEIESNTKLQDFNSYRFIKIRSQIQFLDYDIISSTLEDYPEMLSSLLIASSWEELLPLKNNPQRGKQTFQKALKEIKDQCSVNIEQQLALKYILEFGFGNTIAFQSEVAGKIFTAEIQKQYLRESAKLLARKYSRFSEKEFLIVGTICLKSNNHKDVDMDEIADCGDSFKIALKQVIEAYSTVEATIWGNSQNEIIIDPVAIYHEI